MTQEEDLLLKDLSARIFYGTRVKVSNVWDEDKEIEKDIVDSLYCILPDGYINTNTIDSDIPIKDVKPYLRSFSSMTDEERLYFHRNSSKVRILVDEKKIITKPFYGYTIHLFDWLNKNHFDYRNLIGKGLALEAPEGMYEKI